MKTSQEEVLHAVSVFVAGMLDGMSRLNIDEVDAKAEMVAALMDVAIVLCVERGLTPEFIARQAKEHAIAVIVDQHRRTN